MLEEMRRKRIQDFKEKQEAKANEGRINGGNGKVNMSFEEEEDQTLEKESNEQ